MKTQIITLFTGILLLCASINGVSPWILIFGLTPVVGLVGMRQSKATEVPVSGSGVSRDGAW